MTIVNRRNAVLGWGVWEVSKRTAKMRARRGKPFAQGGPSKPLIAVSVAGLASAASALAWRKKRGGENSNSNSDSS